MKIIIVGAGASGLMAAYELTRKGAQVVMLEAENRIGGRIRTLTPEGFVHEIEAGAEFIHGNLPLTMRLMKKAGISYANAGGKMYRFRNGKIEKPFAGKDWGEFYKALEKVRRDMTIQAFVTRHFSGPEYARLRDEVYAMAQGLDLADPSQASIIGIKKEWLSEEPQFRPAGGYQSLMTFLYDQCTMGKFALHLDNTVSEIHRRRGQATVFTKERTFEADAVLLTVALGCSQNRDIKFSPTIENIKCFKSIGYGQVIKIVLEFENAFWNDTCRDLGFLFCDEFTFWTQADMDKPYLTGWIGNAYVDKFESASDLQIAGNALAKLQSCFPKTNLKNTYHAAAVFRYTQNSPSRGGYSWLKPDSKNAIALLNKGIDDTIWFAGEALYRGAQPATVEAALQSGRYTARKIALSRKL